MPRNPSSESIRCAPVRAGDSKNYFLTSFTILSIPVLMLIDFITMHLFHHSSQAYPLSTVFQTIFERIVTESANMASGFMVRVFSEHIRYAAP